MAATSTGVVFIVMATPFPLVGLLRAGESAPDAAPVPSAGRRPSAVPAPGGAGIRTIVKEPNVRVIVGVYGCQTLVAGALRVFIVVMAFQLLDTGNAGVGFLNSATGIGGVVGALATIVIVSRSAWPPISASASLSGGFRSR